MTACGSGSAYVTAVRRWDAQAGTAAYTQATGTSAYTQATGKRDAALLAALMLYCRRVWTRATAVLAALLAALLLYLLRYSLLYCELLLYLLLYLLRCCFTYCVTRCFTALLAGRVLLLYLLLYLLRYRYRQARHGPSRRRRKCRSRLVVKKYISSKVSRSRL